MIEQLTKLGLSRKEAAVYLATLELGEPAGVSTISKKAGINRTTAYDILEVLVKKGIVVSNNGKNSNRFFRAQPPEQLVEYLKEENLRLTKMIDEAKNILPELKSHHRALSGRPKIYFYEGEEGLIRVYEETLKSTENIRCFASVETKQGTIPWYFPMYYKRRTARNIFVRALFPDSPKDRERHLNDKNEMRESRLLPKSKLDFTPEINFFDNKIMIADWKEKLGIIIESKEIANVFKQTFELAWEAAEKYHKEIKKQIKKKR